MLTRRQMLQISGMAIATTALSGRSEQTVVDAKTQVEVEFTANDPGPTLFHCHQQNHMDAGFMMLLRYA
jgi:FtsP/CotA-like multicopper oxidase with cupredoxin domain